MTEQEKEAEAAVKTAEDATKNKEAEGSIKEQIQNLNEGIAKYRRESNEDKSELKNINEKYGKLEELVSSIIEKGDKGNKDEDEQLTSEDQKKLMAWAKKEGLVTKKELNEERNEQSKLNAVELEKQAIGDYVSRFPDVDTDENWEKVKEQFALYKTPTNLKDYQVIFSKIHKELFDEDLEEVGANKARAEMHTKSRLSLGGGSQKVNSGDTNDVEALAERYPSLSKEQIKAQLAEINDIYPDEKN